jgi:D-proline reductase (dithiol) PrdB
MPRLDQLPELNRNSLLTLPVPENVNTPFTRLTKPLSACRVALVTTAGLHLRGDRPFVSGDSSFRVIPSDSPATLILQSHSSIGFDRIPIQRDLNVTFPVDRLRELAENHTIGSTSSSYYSFMGAQRNWDQIIETTGPAVAKALIADAVDVVLLTPT